MEPYGKEGNVFLPRGRELSEDELREGVVNSQNLLRKYEELGRALSKDPQIAPRKGGWGRKLSFLLGRGGLGYNCYAQVKWMN